MDLTNAGSVVAKGLENFHQESCGISMRGLTLIV
jgi:hypothetical protein